MRLSRRTIVAAAAGLALAAGGVGATVAASGSDDADEQARGPAAQRARDAALKLYTGGTVTGIERDVEGRRVWEVEVRRADGTTVDVDLTSDLRRLGAETDDPESTSGARDDDDADDRGDDEAEDRDEPGERDDREETDDDEGSGEED